MLTFNPYDWDIHENPYPVYRALRDEAPVYRNEELGFWALSRHADVLAALRDWERFSSANGVALEAMGSDAERVMSFLAMDPPRQTRLRTLVSRSFTPRRIVRLEPHIRDLAVHYIEQFAGSGKCDIIADFSGRLPMDVVSEMLGIPAEDRDLLRTWADLVVHREEGAPEVPPAGQQAAACMLGYFNDEIARRRRASSDDTLTDALIATEVDGDHLSDAEIIAFLFLMIIAGNETTTKLIGNALYWLWKNSEQRARIDARPDLIPGWVEETLRYDASTQVLYRKLAEDVTLHDVTMPRGDVVGLLIGSANRDERVFENADTFDVTRNNTNSLAFGNGTHFCLGASLARLEGRVALEEVQARLPEYQIDEPGMLRVHSGNVRGYSAIPMTFRT